MKTISEIYKEYKTIPSLQEHMFRVAAVASLICDNFEGELPRKDIITACLLHDMGNIIKFRMDVMPQFFEPEGIGYWQKVQNEYKQKYGDNDHEANVKIIKELNISEKIASLANLNQFSLICEHRNSPDMTIKIVHYSDGRVDPHGIVSYEERMEEARKRYANHNDFFVEERRRKLVACGKDIEKQIFAKCKIRPEDITNESVAPIIAGLKNFVIK
jgi:hypothetical protein